MAGSAVGDPFGGFRMSSTQIGAAGEADVANALMRASNGRFSPFRPMCDDDGIDMLVFDKLTRACLPLQIKTRTATDPATRGTVQFDVRRATCSRDGDTLLLCVLLNADRISACWLIPVGDLESVARNAGDKLVLTPSASHHSQDRYASYRHHSMAGVAHALAGQFGDLGQESL